jgi:monofunctional biosynthetic peptidoglycan transglycosylase
MGNFRTRLLNVGRKRWRWAVWAFLAVMWMPFAQCLWLNIMDPWFTSTMVETSWRHWRKTGEVVWPTYRPVPLERVPRHVIAAALISEDQQFFDHFGFDLDAIERAWNQNQKRSGKRVRGASTISQQVSRNVFLWQGRTWVRKGLEAYYTLWLELLVPKERILELYVNVAEMGPLTFGIDAGAQRWYGKRAEKLTREEAAQLVAMLPGPRTRTPKSEVVREHAAYILERSIRIPKGIGR